MRICALLLLLTTAFLAQTTIAQYACACVKPLTPITPSCTFATPPIPTATNFPTHQFTSFLPQGFLPQYCQPQAYVPQGILPPIYQPPAIVVPIPPPPKDCKSANTTVQDLSTQQESAHPHPFVCIQSVFVGKKDDEKDSSHEEKRSRSRKNKKRRLKVRRKDSDESDDYMDDEEDPEPQWNRKGRRWNRLRSFLSRIIR